MRELRVHLHFADDDRRLVGTLAEQRDQVWFTFDDAFVESRAQVSPLRLPAARGLLAHREKVGVPLPGVFNDARPDGWGLKLLHRLFQSRGRTASSVSPLDELAYLGAHTMGALTFEPVTGPHGDLADAVDLSSLASHARNVWDDRVEDVLPSLVRAAGPSGGARPKALIGMPRDGSPGFCFGEGALPVDWDAWIVKFPTHRDDADVGRREGAWLRMAEAAGLVVPAHQLLALDEVGDVFAVRRFDRPGRGRRVHMLSAAGALDVDFRHVAGDYHHLLAASRALCPDDAAQTLALFRLAVFNVMSVNQDDHFKNVAWLMDPLGQWSLSPSFDLTYAPKPYDERATTVAGTVRDISRTNLEELATRGGIKPSAARAVIDEVAAATTRVDAFLKESGCAGPVSREAARHVHVATARALS